MTETTYATKVNNRYKVKDPNFVDLEDRLTKALDSAPFFRPQLEQTVEEFKRRHNKKWANFEDLKICESMHADLCDIEIDETMQRELNMRHIFEIIDNFQESMVMAIQVYKDATKPKKYIAWDGQHTAIALHILSTRVFQNHKEAKIKVPIVLYSNSHKLQIRQNFIKLNGDAKKPLDFIDTYKQMVFGVTVDKCKDQEWIDTAKKNQYFADADLFATNKKFGDEDEVGAFTLLADTLMSKSIKTRKPVAVTEMFAKYWTRLAQKRPVAPKEARQLYEYFNLCYEQKIKVNDNYIKEMVLFTKKYFGADFGESGMFWDKVKTAYTNWYRNKNEDSEDLNEYGEVIVRGFTTEMRTGIPFLIAQMKKSTNLKTPTYIPNNGFTPLKKDLW